MIAIAKNAKKSFHLNNGWPTSDLCQSVMHDCETFVLKNHFHLKLHTHLLETLADLCFFASFHNHFHIFDYLLLLTLFTHSSTRL